MSSQQISENAAQTSEDDEYVEEELLVYVDIEPTSLAESQVRDASCFKIVGNEKNAIIQIDNKFFQGEYDYSIGTHVFFEKDEETPIDPLYTRCDNFYQCTSKTNKTLKMNRVLLKDSSLESMDVPQSEALADEESLRATRTYEQALNLFLPPNKKPPREITGEDEISISAEIVNQQLQLTQPTHEDEAMDE